MSMEWADAALLCNRRGVTGHCLLQRGVPTLPVCASPIQHTSTIQDTRTTRNRLLHSKRVSVVASGFTGITGTARIEDNGTIQAAPLGAAHCTLIAAAAASLAAAPATGSVASKYFDMSSLGPRGGADRTKKETRGERQRGGEGRYKARARSKHINARAKQSKATASNLTGRKIKARPEQPQKGKSSPKQGQGKAKARPTQG